MRHGEPGVAIGVGHETEDHDEQVLGRRNGSPSPSPDVTAWGSAVPRRRAASHILGSDWAGRVDTEPMTAATKSERSGPAIRAALTELSPAECEEFETEFRQALARADVDFDLGHVDAVLDRWWGIAAMCANPLTEQERELIVQARAGVDTGWYVRKNDSWVQL